MEYTKLKISSKDDSKRFNRTLAIKGDPDLLTLGAIIGESVHAWFEHCYMFRQGKDSFVLDSWLDDPWDDESYSMRKHHLSDLGEKNFTYEYDTGEGYEFECHVLKKKYVCNDYEDEEDYPLAIFLDGKGQGIFEDDHYTMWRLFNGEIDPNFEFPEGYDPYEDYDEDLPRLPMNMDFDSFADFDKPLDEDDFCFDEFNIERIVQQFSSGYSVEDDDFEDYDDDFDDDEELSEENIEIMVRTKVAFDIFNNPKTLELFKKLNANFDLCESYETLVEGHLKALAELNETSNMNFEELEEEFDKIIENTVKEKLK